MMHALRRLVFLSSVLGAACVPDLDDDASIVGGPRVLAIIAEPPEASEGSTVRLSALAAAAEGAQPQFAFCTARKPLSELGPVDRACLDPGGGVLEPLGSGASVAAALDRDACSRFGPRRPSAEPGQPAGRAVDPDPTGGYYQPVLAALPGQPAVLGGVRLDCGLPGADRDQVIEYNQRHRPNANPRLERVEVGRDGLYTELLPDAPLAVAAGEVIELRAAWPACEAAESACAGAESYVLFDPELKAVVERREELVASWYATSGRFDDPRTGSAEAEPGTENRWQAPLTPGPVELWVVLRDGRGGVGHAARRIEVE